MKKTYLIVIGILLLVFCLLWTPGPKLATDFIFWSPEDLKQSGLYPFLWRSTIGANGMGQSVLPTMWAWPVVGIISFLSGLGLEFSVITRLVFLIPFVIMGSYSIIKLLKHFSLRDSAIFFGALVYLINSYVLLLIDGGQLFLAMSYAFFPLGLYYFIKTAKEFSLKSVCLLIISWLVVSIFDIRILLVLFFLSCLYFIFQLFFGPKRDTGFITKHGLLAFFIISIFLAGFHFYWIYPFTQIKGGTGIFPETFGDLQSFTSLAHALFLQQPHWFINVFGKVNPINGFFGLFPILAFAAAIFPKKRFVGFWMGIVLVFAFLAKGNNPPITGIYDWLLGTVPGFNVFRDPSKFFFPIALSYSVLAAITISEINNRLNWNVKLIKREIPIIPLLLSSYLIVLIYPVYTGKMTGMFSPPIQTSEHREIAELLNEDKEFGRSLWLPGPTPLSFSSPTHPVVKGYEIVQKRPFAIGRVGEYERDNYLRESSFINQILEISSIKYIAFPFPDSRRQELKMDNINFYFTFLEQIRLKEWVLEQIFPPPVALLETKKHQDLFFITENTIAVVGSDNIYKDLLENPGFSLSNNALVFLEESFMKAKFSDLPKTRKLINVKNDLDLTIALFVSGDEFFFPAKLLGVDPSQNSDSQGWWKRNSQDFVWWRNFLQNKYSLDNQDFDYGGGWAIAEGSKELKVNNLTPCDGCVLLARLMTSSQGGKMEFLLDGDKIGEIDTSTDEDLSLPKTTIKQTGHGDIPDQYFEYDTSVFSWETVGSTTFKNNSTLSIKTEGQINVINSLVVIPKALLNNYSQEVDKMVRDGDVIKFPGLTDNRDYLAVSESPAKVSFQRITPTHYQIEVQGLVEPSTLAFSENYDPSWGISASENKSQINYSYPLYSLINGFLVTKDGSYDIYYEPQKYVSRGLVVSLVTTVIYLGICLLTVRKFRIRKSKD